MSLSKDDKVEIAATVLGAFVLGASFAKEFFLYGKFDMRVFFLGISCFVLFLFIALIARVRLRLFDRRQLRLSFTWLATFALGSSAAVDLFNHQFVAQRLNGNIRLETALFFTCFTLATNALFVLNRDILLGVLHAKTMYKYLLGPINGLSAGALVTGFSFWASG